jgi:hypothetical protein
LAVPDAGILAGMGRPALQKAILLLLPITLSAVSGVAIAGAWAEGSFDNDDALDWAYACSTTKSVGPVRQALQRAIDEKVLHAPDGSSAIAAAEVVAAAKGRPSSKLPPELAGWTKRQPPSTLVQMAPLALRALMRVRDPKASELRQLWDEGDSKRWLAAVAELESRLR